MTRNLKALGLMLAAFFAVSAVAASSASAEAAKFTVAVGPGETARINGGQIATDTFTVGTTPPLTCGTATVQGVALTAGPESTEVTLTPTYATCHVVFLGVTKPATVTMNSCAYRFNATRTAVGGPYSADLTIECPVGNEVQIHIYNDSAHTETLCTFDIATQSVTSGFSLTNHAGNPNDVIAKIKAKIAITNTILGGLCPSEAHPAAIYEGEDTLQAKDAGGSLLNASVS